MITRGRGWVLFLVAGAVASAAYLGLPGTSLHSGPVFNAFGLAAVVAIAVGAHRQRAARLPWLLVAGGQLMLVTGDVLAYNYERFFGGPLPFPSIADVFYLATYPLLIAGFVLLIRRRTPTHDRAAIIDTIIIWTASGVLVWTLLIAPYYHDPTLTLGTKLTSIAYPVMDLGLVACVIRFALGGGRRGTPLLLLLGGTTTVFVTDCIYGWRLLHGGYSGGGLLDAGWIAFYLLLGAAALHPQAGRLVEPVPDTAFRLTRFRITMLTCASLAAPAVLAVQSVAGRPHDVPLLVGCSAVAFGCVMLRLFDLVRRHDGALRRVTALADSGGSLIAARTEAEVVDAALAAAQEIVGAGTEVSFSPAGEAPSEAVLRIPLRGRRESRGSLVIRAGGVARDADTATSLETLANQTALTLDNVLLDAELVESQARARFESLVQNAHDVILVLDAVGRITFASPSASRVIGAEPTDLQDRLFLDLVVSEDRPKVAHTLLGSAPSDDLQALELELDTRGERVEVEATCTDLSSDEGVGAMLVTLRDIGERKNFERQLVHRAFHDDLTGLANRVLFRDRVEQALARVERTRGGVAVFFVDLDDFKTINDSLGHSDGDEVLRIVSKRIAAELRSGDTAARLGGDEFAVLVENGAQLRSESLAERLLAAIAAPISLEGRQVSIAASIGVTEAVFGSGVSVGTLLRQADVAMYSAKDSGKAGYRSFEPEMYARVLERLQLKGSLELALENGEFELHYQPVVDLSTGKVEFLEALLRWRHPEHGLILPGTFIPLTEETGLIVPIGAWVLEEAVHEALRLRELLGDDAPAVSVNVSARQLQRPELADEVQALLDRTALPPTNLILEATETVLMEDLDLALPRLEALKRHGIRFAIDDFGTGYSSLNYIRRLPVDILKIDRSFIAGIDNDPGDAALARTILGLAADMNMLAVAEGIEDQRQRDVLHGMGCPLGQGYLFMRPTDAAGIEAALLRRQLDLDGSAAVTEPTAFCAA